MYIRLGPLVGSLLAFCLIFLFPWYIYIYFFLQYTGWIYTHAFLFWGLLVPAVSHSVHNTPTTRDSSSIIVELAFCCPWIVARRRELSPAFPLCITSSWRFFIYFLVKKEKKAKSVKNEFQSTRKDSVGFRKSFSKIQSAPPIGVPFSLYSQTRPNMHEHC
jgi:hypothetical protein